MPEVVARTEHFECTTCRSRKQPPSAAKSGPPPARHLNDWVQMDVFYVQLETCKATALHLVDVATRFGAAEENGQEITREAERAWLRPYGSPRMIQCDEARPFCIEEVKV